MHLFGVPLTLASQDAALKSALLDDRSLVLVVILTIDKFIFTLDNNLIFFF